MVTRADMVPWVSDAVAAKGGTASIVEIAKHIWVNHERDILASGDLLYKWQYEMRWAGNVLVKAGKLDKTSRRGYWRLLP